MTKLVSQNSHDFLSLALLNQSIIYDNMLLPWQTKKVGVAVSTSLATINNIEFVQGEFELSGQSFNTSLERALLERRELVKQWENSYRINCNGEDLETGAEQPEIVEEAVTSLLHNAQESSKDRWSQNKGESLRLEHIYKEELWSVLVEAEFLLEDKGVVQGCWQRQ